MAPDMHECKQLTSILGPGHHGIFVQNAYWWKDYSLIYMFGAMNRAPAGAVLSSAACQLTSILALPFMLTVKRLAPHIMSVVVVAICRPSGCPKQKYAVIL